MATIKEETRTVAELIGGLAQDMSLLVRQEVQLAKVEMAEKTSAVARDMLSLTAGGLVAWIGALALTAAIILFLTQVVGITAWLSALIVGAVMAGVGVAMLRGGARNLKGLDLAPRRTMDTLKDDVQWAKEQRP